MAVIKSHYLFRCFIFSAILLKDSLSFASIIGLILGVVGFCSLKKKEKERERQREREKEIDLDYDYYGTSSYA